MISNSLGQRTPKDENGVFENTGKVLRGFRLQEYMVYNEPELPRTYLVAAKCIFIACWK